MRIRRADFRQNGPPPRLKACAGDGDWNSNSLAESSLSTSIHDTHTDNSDYLWCLDYNPLYRDGSGHHTSVLSSVSASYKGIGELASRLELDSRYDELARDLDANLAEADMESFRTEDIHALLLDLPLDMRHHERTRDDDSSINTMSICKSELLFSPVKEPAPHGVHFSVDSLDCELPSERELILTCRANKDNYTIAFEGSAYDADDHVYADVDTKKEKEEVNEERTRRNLQLLEMCHQLTDKLAASMARSEHSPLTTWSKLRKPQSPLRRHGSGNNNQVADERVSGSVIKSHSLPNLSRRLASSAHSAAMSNSTIDSFTHATNQRLQGAGACIKVFDLAQNRSHCSQHSEPMSSSSTENQSSSDKSQLKQPFNLVKLFMKQKSMSNEGIVSMEQLGSECWPSSSGGESDSFGDTKKPRKMEKLPKMSTSEDEAHDEPDYAIPTPIYEAMNKTQTLTCNKVYEAALIEEEETEGNAERVDNRQFIGSESNLYATVNKSARRNVNNNNSPLRVRNTRRSCSSSATSFSISSCSESDTQVTRMHRLLHKDQESRATSTQVQVETVDRSMQTSSFGMSYIKPERECIKVVEPSFLKKLKEGDCQKPVFILYPNYTLPDISFLNGRPNIYLNPQKVSLASSERKKVEVKGRRPFSCNDLELLRKKGFGHIRDWDSLNFLLPTECRQLLSELPEVMQRINKVCPQTKFSSTPKPKCRPSSCDCNNLGATHVSSSSSTATQPSSGYRGSSTMLNDSAQHSPAPVNFNPLFVYRYDSSGSEASFDKSHSAAPRRSLDRMKSGEIAPPRPPLPKGILRKSADKTRRSEGKRYSMFEMEEQIQDVSKQKVTKRRSLHEPYYLQKQNSQEKRKNNDLAAKRLSQQFLDAADKDADCPEYIDEGVGTESSFDSGKHDIKRRAKTPPMPKPRSRKLEYIEFPPASALISSTELEELEEFLEKSGFSCDNMEEWDHKQVLKNKTLSETPIREEAESTPEEHNSPRRNARQARGDSSDVAQKRALVSSVTDAVEALIQHFAPATDQSELAALGQSAAAARLVLGALCPALYAVLSDGLKDTIETSFGAVDNGVWQMVEATARQGGLVEAGDFRGPITRSLHELVLRINSEDAVTEGLVKFNAFMLGLLNARSVDAWLSYVRTRESDLRKHYAPRALLRLGRSDAACRGLLDSLLACLEPLRLLPFRLDIMFEMRELQRSFRRLESEVRAASRVECQGEDSPRCRGAPNSPASASRCGKFRRLQLKWELLSNGDSPPGTPPDVTDASPAHAAFSPGAADTSPGGARGSRIPRPVTSPVRPAAPLASPARHATHRGIPVAVRKTSSPTAASPRQPSANTPVKRPSLPNRTSRAEQASAAPPARPSSLQCGRSTPTSAPASRRAASSLTRQTRSPARLAPGSAGSNVKPKMVRTLWHRLPSDSGHLAFHAGERLRLVLEVDRHWLLCCRGETKGLVPRDAVILEHKLEKL